MLEIVIGSKHLINGFKNEIRRTQLLMDYKFHFYAQTRELKKTIKHLILECLVMVLWPYGSHHGIALAQHSKT